MFLKFIAGWIIFGIVLYVIYSKSKPDMINSVKALSFPKYLTYPIMIALLPVIFIQEAIGKALKKK